jgi:large subunit ribosomal protein L5
VSFFHYYYNYNLKSDFVTKYLYTNVYQLPKLEKIVLSFTVSQTSLKNLLPLLSAMMLITSHKPCVITSKRLNISLKVKSGLPVGCKVNLRSEHKFLFFEKLVFSVFPRLRDFSFVFREKILFFSIPNLFVFKEVEKEFEHFYDLPLLTVSVVFYSKSKKEIVDFLREFYFPFFRRG